MKRDSIKVNFGYNLFYNFLNIIIPLITAPYTSRVLGAPKIGINSYTLSITSTLIMVGAMGSATYGQKEIAAAGDDIVKRSEKFWGIWIFKGLSLFTSFLVFLPIAAFSDDSAYFFLQAPYFLAGILDISFLYSGLEKFKYTAIRNSIVRIVCLILIFVLVKNEDHLWIYILIVCLSQLLGNLSMWPYLKGNICKVKLGLHDIFSHFKPMIVFFIPSVTYQIYAVLDKAMLGWLVGSDYENGYYEQAHKIVNMIVSVISSYTVVMRSRMSLLYPRELHDKIKENLNKSYNIIPLITFPMMLGLYATAHTIVPWFFGKGYDPVVNIIRIFCPIFVFMGYSRMIGTHILTPSGRQGKSNKAQIAAALANIVLNAILIPKFFSNGAAISSVISEIVIMVLYCFFVRKEVEFIDVLKSAWKKVVASIVMFVVVFPLSYTREPSIIFSFVLVLIGGIVYSLALIILRDVFIISQIKAITGKIRRKIG